MVSKIKKVIKKIFFRNKPKPKSLTQKLFESNKIIFGQNSIFEQLNLNIRNDFSDKTYLKVGVESVISGDYIFENENGNICIGDRTFVGGGGKFISINNISIGDDVLISWGCTFMDNNAHSLKWSERKDDVKEWKRGIDENKVGHYKDWTNVKSAPIVIKDKVWIGFEVVVLKGVTIGEGAIIGSRSVITKDVPDWTIVAGNPAQVIREIPENER